ncbi:VOC family protein [Haloarchaeobius sp. HRN-SO-5]|uniref:VOC family protein n=1 Tax=Haloarchaeobius sp. HRN-SO-5 TaxID=3446118 RepID=UPI003EC09718
MSGVKKFEHATLRVEDLDEAVEFYTDVMGLVEIERTDGAVYLGCGLDENYDVGLVEGQTGVEHFAIRLADGEELAHYENRLEDAGVDVERTDGAEPNQVEGVRFSLPSGVDMELVTVADASYHHPTKSVGERRRVTPRDVDHINLMSWDPDRDREFLETHLDFRMSDKIVGESGFTIQAWLRFGEFHHDVGISTADNVAYTLHHLSFEMEGFDQIKAFADRLTEKGYQFELGPSRHNAGANNFAYLWTPGGNRIELTAEMATVDEGAEPGVRQINREENTVSNWGGVVPGPEFLEKGS